MKWKILEIEVLLMPNTVKYPKNKWKALEMIINCNMALKDKT